jgi:hypothetical protein
MTGQGIAKAKRQAPENQVPMALINKRDRNTRALAKITSIIDYLAEERMELCPILNEAQAGIIAERRRLSKELEQAVKPKARTA